LVIKRVRVLGSGPHTPTQFFWEYPPWDISLVKILIHFSLLFLNTNSQFSYAIKIFFSTAALVITSCCCVIPSIHLSSFMPKEFVALNINKS